MSAKGVALAATVLCVAAALLPTSCSLVVSSELSDVRCTAEGSVGPPACDVGQFCGAGSCVDCGSVEVCGDGLDDDCDGVADDGCGDGGNVDIGAPCTGGCGPGTYCFTPPSGEPFCTVPCCRSEECGDGTAVCSPASGSSVCWPAYRVGRPAPGSKPAGAICAADGECRSARCVAGVCRDVCCSAGDCDEPGAPQCVLDAGAAPAQFTCGVAPGNDRHPDTCATNDTCTSGLCSDASGLRVCTRRCCQSSDCAIAVVAGGTVAFRCRAAETGVGPATICVADSGQAGELGPGESCTANAECRSGDCRTGDGEPFCSDACCTNSDCGEGFACRPVEYLGVLGTRCVRAP